MAGCKNVVKVIDWAPDPLRRFTRIIYEFCPYGDLHGVFAFYCGITSVSHAPQSTGSAAHLIHLLSITVPEAFLWHLFHSIAAAICYNAHGATDGTVKPGWVPIVHRDIKPENSESRRLYDSV